MNREEQIRNKARELGQTYFPDSSNIWARSNVEAAYVENACVEMARWLDQHPNWISVEDELPELNTAPLVRMDLSDKFDEETIIYDVVVYDYNGFHTPYNVTHWMKIQPPRKEE